MSRLLDNLLVFGRVLRRAGIDVHPGRMIDVVEALGHVNLAARDEVYHTCRALLVHRPEQLAVFDLAFDTFWRQRLGRLSSAAATSKLPSVSADMLQPPPQELSRRWVRFPTKRRGALVNAVRTERPRGVAGKTSPSCSRPNASPARAGAPRLNPGNRRTRRWVRDADRASTCGAPISESLHRRRDRHLQAPSEGRPAAPAGPPL
jgi:hypothetical protein